MPVLQENWIRCPLTVVRDMFERGEGGSDGGWGISEFFESKLSKPEEFSSVPGLNAASLNLLHNGCLVCFTGMIQDQFDPEHYFKVYHTSTAQGDQGTYCGLYTDHTQQSEVQEVNWEHPSNVLSDRQTLYCVPVPAETQWVKDIYLSRLHSVMGTASEGTTQQQSSLKRKYNDDGDDGEVGVAMEEEEVEGGAGFHTKKPCSGHEHEEGDHQHHDLNFPLPDEKGLPCMIKVYKDFEQFKVGSIIQAVGVLSIHPLLAPLTYSESSSDEQHVLDTIAERKAHCPPPALVPRLHAITAKLLPHSNPLLPVLTFPIQPSAIGGLLTMETSAVQHCRTVLLDMLTQVLCGDSLAAEYVLLHLLSYVYGRMEVMALGKYSLNLSGCCGQTQPLYQLLTSLLTKCFLLPLTLDNMNTWRFTPKKDYDSNRILASVLQLAPGTEILVDETVLTPGQLTQEGVANLTALGNVIQWQRLSYDFQFHTADFDCDLCVLILSEGKSMLKVDCHVPLLPTSPAPTFSGPPTPELINKLRQYLTLCRGLDYTLTPDMKSSLEEDFVRMRGNNPELTGAQFHHLLCTARLVAISQGCSSLSPQHWTHACTMDKQRLHRVKTREN